MAATDAPEGEPAPTQKPVSFDSLLSVLRARGVEPTGVGQQGREQSLIERDHHERQRTHSTLILIAPGHGSNGALRPSDKPHKIHTDTL